MNANAIVYPLILVLIGNLAVVPSVIGAPPTAEGGPEKVSIVNGYRPMPLQESFGFEGHAGNVLSEKGGAQAADFVTINATDDGQANLPKAKTDGYYIRYPTLRKGDIVPMFSAVYRVMSMSAGGRKSFGTQIHFLRLPDEKHEYELPQGVEVLPDTYVLPFGIATEGALHRMRLRASFVEESKDASRDAIAAKIIIEAQIWSVKQPSIPAKVMLVRVGDSLPIGSFTHRVMNIVPPDPKQHVIGWIEISQTPEKGPAPDK